MKIVCILLWASFTCGVASKVLEETAPLAVCSALAYDSVCDDGGDEYCTVIATTSGGTCSEYCNENGYYCDDGWDDVGGNCSFSLQHGCQQRFENQICKCKAASTLICSGLPDGLVCEEGLNHCTVFSTTSGSTCSEYCNQYEYECLDGWDDVNNDGQCGFSQHVGCEAELNTQICKCEKDLECAFEPTPNQCFGLQPYDAPNALECAEACCSDEDCSIFQFYGDGTCWIGNALRCRPHPIKLPIRARILVGGRKVRDTCPLKWSCIDNKNANVFARYTPDGPQCYSSNGEDCDWGKCQDSPPPTDEGIPITCGDNHKEVYGHRGYLSLDSFCSVVMSLCIQDLCSQQYGMVKSLPSNDMDLHSVEECKILCTAVSWCRAYNFLSTGKCRLYDQVGQVYPADTGFTGICPQKVDVLPPYEGDCDCFDGEFTRDRTNSIGALHDIRSLEDCKIACIVIEKCVGMAYSAARSTCWLKSQISDIQIYRPDYKSCFCKDTVPLRVKSVSVYKTPELSDSLHITFEPPAQLQDLITEYLISCEIVDISGNEEEHEMSPVVQRVNPGTRETYMEGLQCGEEYECFVAAVNEFGVGQYVPKHATPLCIHETTVTGILCDQYEGVFDFESGACCPGDCETCSEENCDTSPMKNACCVRDVLNLDPVPCQYNTPPCVSPVSGILNLTRPLSGESQGALCSILEGALYYGDLLMEEFTPASVLGCMNFCSQISTCAAFDFNVANHRCRAMKQYQGHDVDATGSVFGVCEPVPDE